MASAIFFSAAGGSALIAAGAGAHLVLASQKLEDRQWNTDWRGGSARGVPAAGPTTPKAPSVSPPRGVPSKAKAAAPPIKAGGSTKAGASATNAITPNGSVVKNPRDVPIGGATNKPAPPSPFGLFRKHKPTKLPKGEPKAYNPAASP